MPQIRHLKFSLIATLALVGFIDVSRASAQDKAARGKATAVTNVSLTVKVGDRELTFDVDSKTLVQTQGSGQTPGVPSTNAGGMKLTSLIQSGETVRVTYRDVKGRNLATEITRIPSTGSGGRTPVAVVNAATGTVKSITDSSLVLMTEGTAATFAIDRETVLVGRNAGAPMSERHASATHLFSPGETVSVSYMTVAGTMRATEIRVRPASR